MYILEEFRIFTGAVWNAGCKNAVSVQSVHSEVATNGYLIASKVLNAILKWPLFLNAENSLLLEGKQEDKLCHSISIRMASMPLLQVFRHTKFK